MPKRLLSVTYSELANYSCKEIIDSIAQCESRVLAAETINNKEPLLSDITNVEVASAMGADIVILNLLDTKHPVINGLDETNDDLKIKRLKKLTGRIIGTNLEPVEDVSKSDSFYKMTEGRIANKENALRCKELGIQLICVTANPNNKVTCDDIAKAVKVIRDTLKDDIIISAGKMHSAGILNEQGENIINKEIIDAYIESGTDIIDMPAPGTLPGITMEYIKSLCEYVHSKGKLAMATIGTSQEGSDSWTIKNIALMSKMAGVDIHHIGDTGYVGMALPENITTYSIAIRGVRHTYHRMAMSVNR